MNNTPVGGKLIIITVSLRKIMFHFTPVENYNPTFHNNTSSSLLETEVVLLTKYVILRLSVGNFYDCGRKKHHFFRPFLNIYINIIIFMGLLFTGGIPVGSFTNGKGISTHFSGLGVHLFHIRWFLEPCLGWS